MTRNHRLIAALVAGAVLVTVAVGCASPRDIRRELEPSVLNPDGRYHIYVAAEDSSWKQDVISDLAASLGTDYRITVQNLRTLEHVDGEDWDVIVVLSAFYAFGLQSDTAAFLEEAEPKSRIILVVTSNISDPGRYGVDTISAASQGSTPESAKALTPARAPADVAQDIARLVVAKTR